MLLLAKCNYRVFNGLKRKMVYSFLKFVGIFVSKQKLVASVEKCIKEIAKGKLEHCYELTGSEG